MMQGQRVVKVFCHEEESKEAFDKLNDALCESSYKANVSAVSGMFSINIQTVVLIIVIALLKSCGIDWLIICLSVSVSFVSCWC